MAYPKKNAYWKLRSKHGRNRIIKDPEALMESANDYFQMCVDNPLIEIDFKGKDLQRVEIPHPKVFQKDELAIFSGCNQWSTINDLKKVNDDFFQVVTHIEKVIRGQKFQYAAVNMFNSNIIARDLGLKDRKDVTTDDQSINLTEDERNARIIALQKKLSE